MTLADPVALYIDSFTPVGFVTPDNSDAKQFWKVTRGAPGFAVRAEFEVPASKNYVVGAAGPKRSSHPQCGMPAPPLLLPAAVSAADGCEVLITPEHMPTRAGPLLSLQQAFFAGTQRFRAPHTC